MSKKSIVVDGINYVPEGTESVSAKKLAGKEYVICRTYSAGVFAGYLDSRTGQEVVLLKARRLWYWKGSASLSELAMKGVSCPDECKFPCEVDKVELLQSIEIIPCTEIARESIASVKIWTAHN
jgi:hypothetical protein